MNFLDELTHQRLPLFLLFASFVITFIVTRVITRLIRAGKGPFRNNVSDGVHVHHMVPGLILTIVGAFLSVGVNGASPGAQISAVLIGVGVDNDSVTVGLIRDGDIVDIDLSARKLNVEVSDEELAAIVAAGLHVWPIATELAPRLLDRGLCLRHRVVRSAAELDGETVFCHVVVPVAVNQPKASSKLPLEHDPPGLMSAPKEPGLSNVW